MAYLQFIHNLHSLKFFTVNYGGLDLDKGSSYQRPGLRERVFHEGLDLIYILRGVSQVEGPPGYQQHSVLLLQHPKH